MHLLLIRHGETEHNVANLLVGVTDSRLTNHGVLQAERLGKALVTKRNLRFTRIFTSTLQRAWITAEEIRKQQVIQVGKDAEVPEVIQLEVLMEQDFGSFEKMSWASKRAKDAINPAIPDPDEPGFKARETPESLKNRANKFIDHHLVPLLLAEDKDNEEVVAVVCHGIFLSYIWRSFLLRFSAGAITIGPDAILPTPGMPVESIRKWGNTSYLELTIRPSSTPQAEAQLEGGTKVPILSGWNINIIAVNQSDHVTDLKRNGVGSAPYDFKQQSIADFFKKRKIDEDLPEPLEKKLKDEIV